MKYIVLIFSLICITSSILGQVRISNSFELDFEEPFQLKYLSIDTLSNPENVWQIGQPNKSLFHTALSVPNVIVTDTIQNYPPNDTSIFVITTTADLGLAGQSFAVLSGYYQVNTDSLNDFGLIEFSPNNGVTWINLIEDSLYSELIVSFKKPTLTGNSNGWKQFNVGLSLVSTAFNINIGDTILFRFTFISDENPDSLEGLMFDDLDFIDVGLGINESVYNSFNSKAYPNPTNSNITIEFDNPEYRSYQLIIHDNLGRQIQLVDYVPANQVQLDVLHYKTGIYYYSLLYEDEKIGSWGKFIVE